MRLIFKRSAGALSSEAGYVVARLWILRLQLPVLVQKDFISIIILALAKSIASNVHPRSEILHTNHLAIDLNDKVSNMQSLACFQNLLKTRIALKGKMALKQWRENSIA